MYKQINNFKDYLIYDDGNVYSTIRQKYIKQELCKSGYMRVTLRKNGKSYHKLVHRLVAIAFIPNPHNLPQVNHKDEDKTNNNVSNLEWITAYENTNYGTGLKRRIKKQINNPFRSKKVNQYDKNMNLIQSFPSIKEAERQTGFANTNISNACREINRTVGGYYWRYIYE